MADIRIEKKENNSSILPWIIGLLVLALAIWAISSMFNKDEVIDEPVVEEVTPAREETSAVVKTGDSEYTLVDFENDTYGKDFNHYYEQYMSFTADMSGDMGLDHKFSHDALIMLANATSSLARAQGMGAETHIKTEEKKIREAANYITKDPYATDHADKIRMAAMSIVSVLEKIQQAKYPGLEGAMEDVKRAANDISKETLTLNQKEDVRGFFGKAKALLTAMRDMSPQR